ncbi:MAG: DUF928 domain-containing protein [bacterium]|nr:hypothetical protein [Deltaproteobacteria bacterium]MCP4905595.1 DUF928 domain-containing protein [bacterium]
MAIDEQDGLAELYQDVLDSDLPSPELLARYATAPNELTEQERFEVEAAMLRLPAVVDELDTLREFDFQNLNADREAVAAKSTMSSLLGFFARPPLMAGLAASAALALFLVLGQEPPVSQPTRTPNLATTTPEESPPVPAPDSLGIIDEPGEIDLAMDDSSPDTSVPERLEPTVPMESQTVELADDSNAPTPTSTTTERPAPEDPSSRDMRAFESEPGEILIAMMTPIYEMPYGAPSRERLIGGFRAADDEWPRITVLAPAHLARTTSNQPTLFWHIDRLPTQGGFYLTISDAEGEKTIVENLRLASGARAGIQEADLLALDVSLESNEEYRWSIAHRLEDDASPTHFAFGWIVESEPNASTRARIEAAETGERPNVLASGGYWYDALEATIDLVEGYPLDDRPRDALRSLLDQAGVTQVGD